MTKYTFVVFDYETREVIFPEKKNRNCLKCLKIRTRQREIIHGTCWVLCRSNKRLTNRKKTLVLFFILINSHFNIFYLNRLLKL